MKKIKLWWYRLVFSIKYPITYTNPVIWLAAYNLHIKRINKLNQKD